MAADRDAVVGCLLGQAVGDMMGLPLENLSPRRAARLFPRLDRPAFLFGYGFASDDTEHACMTAQALLRSGGDVERFRRSLAWRLRWWFAAGPPGIGLATAKSCVRLWLGRPSARSGVNSAGNGPAMRAAILGMACGTDSQHLRRILEASTFLTHTDRQALYGSAAVAVTVRLCVDCPGRVPSPMEVFDILDAMFPIEEHIPGKNHRLVSETLDILVKIRDGLAAGKSVAEFAADLGLSRGVSGYIAHTVPVALFAFFRHPDDYRAAVEAVIRCGGDTDTVAAIVGALVGARVGKAGIPTEWLERYADWPRSAAWIERLGTRLAEGKWRESPQPAEPLAWWAIPFRNLLFFLVVLGHVVRRALPPY